MKNRCQELNIADRVIFTGLVDNVDEYMKSSDLFVFLSKREGCPNVIIEAMSTGLPVIALNISGVTEDIICDGIDGIIVSEENPKIIATVIEKIIKNRVLYINISKNARETAISRFSTEVIDQEYWSVYMETD